ncbi:hypothetical protein BKA93DRAFT_819932 [Sparassis latifolia]
MAWKAGTPIAAADPDAEPWGMYMVDIFANVSLAHHGYFGMAPVRPTVAVSFRALEAYRQLHRVCPRLSIQGQVRALCFLHSVPFRRAFVNQFSIAYDVYLDILHDVGTLISIELGRNTLNWCMLNVCAPCLYQLQDEPALKFSLLATMDGNQSLKLVDDLFRSGVTRSDGRMDRTDIWLTPEAVDRFKDEVARSNQVYDAHAELDDIDDDVAAEHGNIEGVLELITVCMERWRNAGPKVHKKMFALFAVMGIFVCLCQHGHLLILCDMIRSGELMKQPLAIIDKLIEVYGTNVKVGYDIACAFLKTLARSSLGLHATKARMSGVVPAFHGHGHNWGCQVHWHPLYMDDVGKEDFEGCERCFSESNALAPGMQLATSFHHHQAIEQFFGFWDEQKHIESGNFIYNNYKQALDIIMQDSEVLDVLSEELNIGPAEYERYLEEEREYLSGLKKCEQACVEFNNLDYNIIYKGYQKKEIVKVQMLYRTTYSWYEGVAEEVRLIEEELSIIERWLPGTQEYIEMTAELGRHKYRRALDNLDARSDQFSGYKLCEKIGKALKTRAEAIKKALAEYNCCALELSPARPTLTWSEVMDMVSLADFDLLCDARQDIHTLPWAQWANCQVMNTYFNIQRACEEIERLNVEISCLFTSLVDEHIDYYIAISHCIIMKPALAHILSTQWKYHDRIHEKIAHHLYQTSQLTGFSGKVMKKKMMALMAFQG